MITAILYERTVAVCARMDFWKGLGRSEPWGDSRWSRWRKETMKTGIRIQNIAKKTTRKIFSTRSQRIQIWIEQHRTTFHGHNKNETVSSFIISLQLIDWPIEYRCVISETVAAFHWTRFCTVNEWNSSVCGLRTEKTMKFNVHIPTTPCIQPGVSCSSIV